MKPIATFAGLAMLAGWFCPAQAAAVCNCCVASSACETSCQSAETGQGHCPVLVDYGVKAEPGALNGASYMGIALGEPSAPQLESFRRMLERQRRHEWRAYLRAFRMHHRRRLSDEDFAAAKARYNEAMVNYNHAIHAYLVRLGRKSD